MNNESRTGVAAREGSFENAVASRRRIEIAECHVCRVESAGAALGTGILVGPDLVLTNYHVLGRIPRRDGIEFRFRPNPLVRAPQVHRLAREWVVCASEAAAGEMGQEGECEPGSDQLDFVLVRLETRPGDDGVLVDGEETKRGWTPFREDVSSPRQFSVLRILQHPKGSTDLKVAEGVVFGLNANGTRVLHGVATAKGSSGSPCLSPDSRLLALHNARFSKDVWQGQQCMRAVPASAILAYLGREGLHSKVLEQPPRHVSRRSVHLEARWGADIRIAEPQAEIERAVHALLRDGRLESAREMLEKHGDRRLESPLVRLHAEVLERLGQFDEAERELERAFQRATAGGAGSAAHELVLGRVRLLERQGLRDRALGALAQADGLTPGPGRPESQLEADLARLRLRNLYGLESDADRKPLLARIGEIVTQFPGVMEARPDLMLQLAGEFWRDDRSLVGQTARRVGLDRLDYTQARQLAEGLAMAETESLPQAGARRSTRDLRDDQRAAAARWFARLQSSPLRNVSRFEHLLAHPSVEEILGTVFFDWGVGERPYYHAVEGFIVVRDRRPTGSTLEFLPEEPAALAGLVGVSRSQGRETVGIALEGCAAPELGYAGHSQRLSRESRNTLLGRLGFAKFDFRPGTATVMRSEPTSVRCTILVRGAGLDGRLHAYVCLPGRRLRPGRTLLAADDLRRTLNYELIAAGWVYPTLISSMPDAHRYVLADAAQTAKGEERGVWEHDATTQFPLSGPERISGGSGVLLHPNIFRMCIRYLAERDDRFDGTLLDWLVDPRWSMEVNGCIQTANGRLPLSDLLRHHYNRVRLDLDMASAVFVTPSRHGALDDAGVD